MMNLEALGSGALHIIVFAILAVASVSDIRTRRVSNGLSFSLIASALVVGTLSGDGWMVWSGFLVAAAIGVLLFTTGEMGGGDVKILAGLGAYLGVVRWLEMFVWSSLIVTVVLLVYGVVSGRLHRWVFRTAGALRKGQKPFGPPRPAFSVPFMPFIALGTVVTIYVNTF